MGCNCKKKKSNPTMRNRGIKRSEMQTKNRSLGNERLKQNLQRSLSQLLTRRARLDQSIQKLEDQIFALEQKTKQKDIEPFDAKFED